MARIRTVKPEIWTSEQFVECSTNARLLFIGLWNFCDDGGVHPASQKRVKMEVFPNDSFTDKTILSLLKELKNQKLIFEYKAESMLYWYVTGWEKHQRIEKPTYKYPKPDPEILRAFMEESPTPLPRNGMEGNGMDVDKNNIGQNQVKSNGQDGQGQFNDFWKAYPKKVKKKDAQRVWKTKRLDKQSLIILADIQNRLNNDQRWKDGFIPDPPTYLRGERWNDEIQTPTKSTNTHDDPFQYRCPCGCGTNGIHQVGKRYLCQKAFNAMNQEQHYEQLSHAEPTR